ncbi:MAG: phosphoribosylaminoimidazolesuccinocarboxamide synthase [Leptospiraceae bacterium]|nr:phosphoribosylaminoimidazolesuccinocarboxamide synthase [Leptospiraceae bacterium]
MYQVLKSKPNYIGKVRDVFEIEENLILVSTDRISAFDVVFSEVIQGKGLVLNQVSLAWFEFFKDIPNHIIESDSTKYPEPYNKEPWLKDRSVLVKKCKRIDYECVVRGYLSGSAYKEYAKTGQIAFKNYPSGFKESSKLPEPIFTPARKNDSGHDENISEDTLRSEIGNELFTQLKQTSIHLYSEASRVIESEGLILCDTKFEFGLDDGKLILIDELLTPDSSRYWEKETYREGSSPPSLDKQILRNYLETLTWDKNPPAPSLPQNIQDEILEKYKILEKRITKCISQK